MKKNAIVIYVLLAMVITAGGVLYDRDKKINEVKSDMGFRLIAHNIIQLEGAIMFQMQNNWDDPNSVIEKVEDVIEGINMTRRTTDRFNKLSSEDDHVLMRLMQYYEKFPDYSGFPNYEINETEIKAFERLRKNLRTVGWGMNSGYSSSWFELIEKARELVSLSFVTSDNADTR